jgi:peptide/nickel transport system substrate-binding protein
MKKRLFIFALLIVMVFALTACGSSDTPPDDPDVPGDVDQVLIYGSSTDAASLDPHVQNDSHSEQIVAMIYNTLVRFEPDGEIVGDLAESWTVSDDNLTWTFKLKEGVKFHNGKELTANDVKGTYDRFLADDADAARLVIKNLASVFVAADVVDEYTVSITTKEPYGPMLALLSNRSLAIMDPDVIAEHGINTGDFVESSIGTGAFRLVKWDKDEEMVLERFEDFFDGPAKLEEVRVKIIPEAASRVIALETGEVNFLKQFPAEDLTRLDADANITVEMTPSVGARLFRFGCNDPIISNSLVRQAIVHAIDREAIIDGLFPGMAYSVTGPLSPVVWGTVDLGVIEQDLDKAKDLLAQAGYPDGFETKIVTTPRYEKGVELAEILAAQLADVGIKVNIEVLEWSVILPLWSGVSPQEFDQPMFIMGAGTSMMDADGGLRGLYTTTETGTNERNYGFYTNAEVDELIFAGMKETDLQERASLYKRAQEILYLEDPVGIWLFNNYNRTAAINSLKGVATNGVGMSYFERMYFE